MPDKRRASAGAARSDQSARSSRKVARKPTDGTLRKAAPRESAKKADKPGSDYRRALRLSRKLPVRSRPTEGNTMLVPAENFTDLSAQIKVCTRCRLSQSRTQAVPGDGPVTAKIMLIGEAPGFHEDQQGRPFVGPAGQFLNQLLGLIGMKREDIYITNVVKCRPPQNRDPQPDEIEACRIWLDQQIKLIQPKVIVTISRFAMARWFPDKKISEIHGRARRFGNLLVVPMYHPAAALHQSALRSVLEEDFKKLPGFIEDSSQIKPETGKPPEQLKMF